ncbi:MaoC/PaaZ C-terminal domain-containing protein [Phytohabitans sp. ZYX-F-186]|uniref:MaoC/PaaZ C-terminal domain-containing protein n=1 Tax=Phytohabitans maris TaxID=3071409 RepID=A0ABU0ZEL0_9ACTN|nr:MaoC/PaaZ C-terminal domain-containing protein [Phytohabitans sp. ZYX-F-186]MDQ7905493.1 MaoC/PaaZ C-terminal domain-containing protein [Phytohabitans sp. ZYX-F-186]
MYARAAIGLVPGFNRPGWLPDTVLERQGVTVDRAHLAEYDRVCGFRLCDTLPVTYPHVLAFPLAFRLMSRRDFPFPVVGLVHVANRIELHRPIDAGEALDLSVHAADLREHPRGRQLDVVATASVDGEVVWRDVSTYLRREGKGSGRRRESEPAEPPPASARWRLGPRVGTDYARVSGDHNPIHTSRLGARLFGFARPIAHGMWSKARCLAALEGRLPEAYTVEVAFKLPVLLPSTVAFSAAPEWTFTLHGAKSGKPHLTGSVTAA